MPVTLTMNESRDSRPVFLMPEGDPAASGADGEALAWAAANGFSGKAGKVLPVPGAGGRVAAAFLRLGDGKGGFAPLVAGALANALPEGDWHFASPPQRPDLAALSL